MQPQRAPQRPHFQHSSTKQPAHIIHVHAVPTQQLVVYHTHTCMHAHACTILIQQLVAHTLHIHMCMLYPSSSQLHSCTLMHAVFTHYKHVIWHIYSVCSYNTQQVYAHTVHTLHAANPYHTCHTTHMDIPLHVSDTQRNIHMSHAQSTHHRVPPHAHKHAPIHFSYGHSWSQLPATYLLGSLITGKLQLRHE